MTTMASEDIVTFPGAEVKVGITVKAKKIHNDRLNEVLFSYSQTGQNATRIS